MIFNIDIAGLAIRDGSVSKMYRYGGHQMQNCFISKILKKKMHLSILQSNGPLTRSKTRETKTCLFFVIKVVKPPNVQSNGTKLYSAGLGFVSNYKFPSIICVDK